MKLITALGVVAVAVAAFVVWMMMPYVEARYRFTVEVDTPRGVVIGSSVHAVRWDYRSGVVTSFAGRVRGEAVFVDLGQGSDRRQRQVIALMPENTLLPRLFGARSPETYSAAMKTASARELDRNDPDLRLVTFTDIANPATAMLVDPSSSGFAAAFGPGFAFHRATVEIMPNGVWPFNVIPLPWPQWLFGAPVTRGAIGQLAWRGMRYDDMRNQDGSPLSQDQRTRLQSLLSGLSRKL
jgi:hypothetical protein